MNKKIRKISLIYIISIIFLLLSIVFCSEKTNDNQNELNSLSEEAGNDKNNNKPKETEKVKEKENETITEKEKEENTEKVKEKENETITEKEKEENTEKVREKENETITEKEKEAETKNEAITEKETETEKVKEKEKEAETKNEAITETKKNKNEFYVKRKDPFIVETEIPKNDPYKDRVKYLSQRIITNHEKKKSIVIDSNLTSPINKKTSKVNYVKDRSILDKYFPTDKIIPYDVIANDSSIPENVRKQFFKEAYEAIYKELPQEDIDAVNKEGIASVSELGWYYLNPEAGFGESGNTTKYKIYKNVQFTRTILRDPKPYDPLLKAHLTRVFEVLLTGRGEEDYFSSGIYGGFFRKYKKLILEYLYYSIENAYSLASSSLLDPTLIFKQSITIPEITYGEIIEYYINKENRISGDLLYSLTIDYDEKKFSYPASESLKNSMRKLYKCSLDIINADYSINASLSAIIQATIAYFVINYGSDDVMPIPQEISRFMFENSDLVDYYINMVKMCLNFMKYVDIKESYELKDLLDLYVNYNIKYKLSSDYTLYAVNSLNDSIFKWDLSKDYINYTTSAMELNSYRVTYDDNYLIQNLYKRIYERDYPYLADFQFNRDLITLYKGSYVYKLSDGKNNFKWYLLEDITDNSQEKVNLVPDVINKNSKLETIALGFYKDLMAKRILFFQTNPDTLYSEISGVSTGRGNSVKTLLNEYYISETPIFRGFNKDLVLQGHFDNKLKVTSEKNGEVSFDKKPKSLYTDPERLKIGLLDLTSGNLEVINDTEGWRDILYLPTMDYLFYRKGYQYYIFDVSLKQKYPTDTPLKFGPKEILDTNSSMSKFVFTKYVGRNGRLGIYVYDTAKGRYGLIDYCDRMLFTGSSKKGTYLTYKSYNPFYDEENTFIVNLYKTGSEQ